MHVHLCGVRGSTPAPGREFAEVGGNTSCVAIAHDGAPPSLVLDAGTGLRKLSALLDGQPFRGTIVLSHLHWDHVMGVPFFAAGDHPDARVKVLVPEQGSDAETLIEKMMSPPSFPITPSQLRGRWEFESYGEGTLELEGFSVLAREVPHAGGRTMGLRVADERGSIAYMSDHAPHELGPGERGVGVVHDAARVLAGGVDVLFHDSQYTTEELAVRFTWGHASMEYCVELAEAAGAQRVVLFHHDPGRTDEAVAELHAKLQATTDVPIDIGREGLTIAI